MTLFSSIISYTCVHIMRAVLFAIVDPIFRELSLSHLFFSFFMECNNYVRKTGREIPTKTWLHANLALA